MRRTTHAPATDDRFSVPLRGIEVDDHTRCAHYDGPTDIVAMRLGDTFYPCRTCFEETSGWAGEADPRAQSDDLAVLCGACRTVLTVRSYLACGHACPSCGSAFNPGCAAHRDLYFRLDP